MKQKFNLTINGKQQTLEAEPGTPLLYLLRNEAGLNGPKFGCGLGQCGACMVLLDGQHSISCLLPVEAAADRKITTLDGLAAPDGRLHAVQQAFVDEQAAQCGYCMNGMIMAAVSLLNDNPRPDDAAIRAHMQLNICRCGIQHRVIRAIKRASQQL